MQTKMRPIAPPSYTLSMRAYTFFDVQNPRVCKTLLGTWFREAAKTVWALFRRATQDSMFCGHNEMISSLRGFYEENCLFNSTTKAYLVLLDSYLGGSLSTTSINMYCMDNDARRMYFIASVPFTVNSFMSYLSAKAFARVAKNKFVPTQEFVRLILDTLSKVHIGRLLFGSIDLCVCDKTFSTFNAQRAPKAKDFDDLVAPGH